MRNAVFIFFLLISLLVSPLKAQLTTAYQEDDYSFNQGVDLYYESQYAAAMQKFEGVLKRNPNTDKAADCAYYIANCAIRLDYMNADRMMEDFVENYPSSPKRNKAYLEVANYYFDQGKYPQSQKWYAKVQSDKLSRAERQQLTFNNAYNAFVAKRYDEAATGFNQLITHQKYGNDAKYYLGYIAYQQDKYDEAGALFESGNAQRDQNTSYFEADMNFKQGNFDKAIAKAKEQLPKSNPAERSQLNKIIGESYFNLKQYQEAIPFLKEYKGLRGKWNNTDYYQLGFAYYHQNDYPKAIAEFNKIIDGKNEVAQNAYYHLGQSYLSIDKKSEALNAFKSAAEMDFKPEISEDAYYNYAKLSYDIGNPYQSVPQLLLDFQKKYPNHQSGEELQQLLVSAYVNSGDYQNALEVLEKNKNSADAETYQQVAYLRGIELFKAGDFLQAKNTFSKAINQKAEPKLTAKSRFWKAESAYQLNQFQEALNEFNTLKKESANLDFEEKADIDYHLGYTQFKLKQYDAAIQQFEAFVQNANIDKNKRADAYLRLGDSRFINRSYWPALEAYNAAIDENTPKSDYASYQKAMSYGFVERVPQKIELLENFDRNFPNSSLQADALFQLANTYINENQSNKGILAYDRLIAKHSNSRFVPQAMLRKGLQQYSDQQNNQALSGLKQLVDKFPNSSEALQAVSTVRLIYIDLDQTDQYAQWVQGLDFVNVSNAELDDTAYEAAVKPFRENNFKNAIKSLEKYLNEFPEGLHATEAHFYLAQSLYTNQELQQSKPHYRYVIEQPKSNYTEQSLARLSELLLSEKKYAEAIPVLQRLETEADFEQNKIFAQNNLMKSFYASENYQETVNYAQKVLNNTALEQSIKTDAEIMIARSAIQTEQWEIAEEHYQKVHENATGILAAEALYYQAYFENKSQQFSDSNSSIQQLAKNYSGYKFWAAKSLLLMAENFYALNDPYQATVVLQAVIDNFSSFEDLVEIAQNRLNEIKENEAKTNASVQPEEKE